MAYTQAQLDAIDAAIASGELAVEYEGKKVTYRSMTELMSARSFVASQLVASGAAPAEVRRSLAGYCND